jgi:hypothetical protein
MSQTDPWVIMPNKGRPSGRLSPVGIDHIYKDPNTMLPVELLIINDHVDPRSRHWSISWTVGQSPAGDYVQRVLHIVREVGYNHYTNWGPCTRVMRADDATVVCITEMGKADRLALEDIARETNVFIPNGLWNCQDWVMEVLKKAVEQKLITTAQLNTAVATAWGS